MAENLAQEANIHDTAAAVNELAHKLSRKIESVRDWLMELGEPKGAATPAVVDRPLSQLSDTRATLADAIDTFAELARHVGAPICE